MHRLGSSSLDVSQLDVCYVDPARVLRALEKGVSLCFQLCCIQDKLGLYIICFSFYVKVLIMYGI